MGKTTSYEKSYESSQKRTSYEQKNHMKGNNLSVKERDHMIRRVMLDLRIDSHYKPAVAKAANYIDGPRFWEIFGYAERAKFPAHYFIKAINREMYA